MKPANIMVGAFAEVQVMDWGFAKKLQIDVFSLKIEEGTQANSATNQMPTIDCDRQFAAGNLDSSICNRQSEIIKSSVTHSGALMGTPAYMPPEQARGDVVLVDCRADVFSLGAILCEILTGTAPYRGEAEDVFAQATAGNLTEAIQRLEDCGAESALCHLVKSCLTANREDRLEHAGQVVAGLAQYLTSSQERLRHAQMERAAADARAEQAGAKAQAERRARQMSMALAVAAMLLFALSGLAYWWHDRVQRDQALRTAAVDAKIETALNEVNDFINRRQIASAYSTLTRAKALLDGSSSDRWRERKQLLSDDLNLAFRLDKVIMQQACYDPIQMRYSAGDVLHDFALAFSQYGIIAGMDVDQVATRIRQQHERLQEVTLAGLDNWWLRAFRRRSPEFSWIDEILRAVDTDDWRARVRLAISHRDRQGLIVLANHPDASRQTANTLVMTAWALREFEAFDTTVAMMRLALLRMPNDYWINFELGMALDRLKPPTHAESAHYCKIAAAIRPDTVNQVNLSCVYVYLKNWDGLINAVRRAIELNPNNGAAHYYLGTGLQNQNRLTEAEQDHRRATELNPAAGVYHFGLAFNLAKLGRYAEALGYYDRAIDLEPGNSRYHFSRGIALEETNDLQARPRPIAEQLS